MIKRHNTIGLWVALTLQGLSLQSLKREEGQTLAEYAMILALIAIAVVTAVVLLGSKIGSLFSSVGSSI
jgi:pilus assembly protein Flp/PilA